LPGWRGDKKKVTRREQFWAEMNAVIPWAALVALIAPHYPTAGGGRPPMPLETMLRIYFLQQWFDLSDPAAEDAIYDSESMRRFVGVELCENAVPDETTILRVRRLLEEHALTEQMFALVRGLLETHGLLMKTGTIVDATIIRAPSSTKNATGTREPEMKQVRKGQQWCFGMRVHVGTDLRGLVHSLTTTHAAASKFTSSLSLLHGDERALYADRGYWSETARQACEAAGLRHRVIRRGNRFTPVSERWRAINRARARIRARGEHGFHVVKTLWGFSGLFQRALSRPVEEHGARLRPICPRHSVPRAAHTRAARGAVSLVVEKSPRTHCP
jgi:transposase, IS5 family